MKIEQKFMKMHLKMVCTKMVAISSSGKWVNSDIKEAMCLHMDKHTKLFIFTQYVILLYSLWHIFYIVAYFFCSQVQTLINTK